MKYPLLFFFLFASICGIAQEQNNSPQENVVITSNKGETLVRTNERGDLEINVSKKNLLKLKENGYVLYSYFGAEGDGKTDDIDAIAAAHAIANQEGLSVKADEGASYYIGGKVRTAVIQTDTDFGTAKFIIDDTDVEDHREHVFLVRSTLSPSSLRGYLPLKETRRK